MIRRFGPCHKDVAAQHPGVGRAYGTNIVIGISYGGRSTGTVTDSYTIDAFGRLFSSTGSTRYPYHFGGDWGYQTDPSGLLQLGARWYWPELGRFIQQDPAKDGANWYAYVENNPLTGIDPEGLGIRDWIGRSWRRGGVHGAGAGATETTDLGLWKWSAGQTGAAGSGLFWGGSGGLRPGGWASWGGFERWGNRMRSWPGCPTGSNIGALGAFAGGGGMLWLTNATSAGQLRGPFMQGNANAGWRWKVGGASFAYSHGTYVFAYGGPFGRGKTGIGYGAAVSEYPTNTWATR